VTDDKSLGGKRALVVGGGRGIGRAVSLALGADGAAVAVADMEAERASGVVDELESSGTKAVALTGDVRSLDSIEELVASAASQLGGIDVLVTVVGGTHVFAPFQALHEYTDEQWESVFDVNLRYVFRVVRAVLNLMLEQGTGGSIVSIGSISGVVSAPAHGPYGSAKAGVIQLARTVAAEYGRYGIRMNVVSPGLVATPAATGAHTGDEVAAINGRTPLGRRGEPEDIADAVVFFASPRSRYVTGQALLVDGGMTVHYPAPLINAHPSSAG
jgi:3-oxoacyl-[acyl-carrier protein] reductase